MIVFADRASRAMCPSTMSVRTVSVPFARAAAMHAGDFDKGHMAILPPWMADATLALIDFGLLSLV